MNGVFVERAASEVKEIDCPPTTLNPVTGNVQESPVIGNLVKVPKLFV